MLVSIGLKNKLFRFEWSKIKGQSHSDMILAVLHKGITLHLVQTFTWTQGRTDQTDHCDLREHFLLLITQAFTQLT